MKRILVATDLTEGAEKALARAIRLAAQSGAAIHLVHAGDRSEDCVVRRNRLLTKARLTAEKLAGRELDLTLHISSRSATDAILRAAERFNVDLIVLGAHGTPRLSDAIFGTTATHIVRHTKRPVLVVQNDPAAPYAKILVAIDDPASARPLLAVALDIAPASEMFAVHAFYPSLNLAFAGRGALGQQEAGQERELEEVLAEMAAGGTAPQLSTRSHAVVETGEVLSVLMDQARAIEPDLIAMGTRHQASYLGSRAVDTLFWCPHDVLVVPEQDA